MRRSIAISVIRAKALARRLSAGRVSGNAFFFSCNDLFPSGCPAMGKLNQSGGRWVSASTVIVAPSLICHWYIALCGAN